MIPKSGNRFSDKIMRKQNEATEVAAPEQELRPPSYWPFVVPALFVVLANYLRLPNDPRFVEAVGHTIVYTILSVLLPLVLGTFAAVVFHQKFAGRGFLRGVF